MSKIDIVNSEYMTPDKDFQFEKGDIITFSELVDDKSMGELNFVGMIKNVEGRYVTIIMSTVPVVSNELNNLQLDRSLTVKMNGYAKFSLMNENGVMNVNLQIADVVNDVRSIIIKNMVKRKEAES